METGNTIECIGRSYLNNNKETFLRQKRKFNFIMEIKNIIKIRNNHNKISTHQTILTTRLKILIIQAIIITNTKMLRGINLIRTLINQIKLALPLPKMERIIISIPIPIQIIKDLDLMTLNKTILQFIIMLEIYFIQIKKIIEKSIN